MKKKKEPVKKKHKHHHDWGHKRDDRMRYETGWPMHFVMPGGGSLWRKCEACGRECMGEDSLAEHAKARHG